MLKNIFNSIIKEINKNPDNDIYIQIPNAIKFDEYIKLFFNIDNYIKEKIKDRYTLIPWWSYSKQKSFFHLFDIAKKKKIKIILEYKENQ